MLRRLPSIDLCADPQVLASGLPPPPDRRTAAQLEQARDHLARQGVRLAVADLTGADTELKAAATLLAAIDDGPTQGELARARGLLALARSDRKSGIDSLQRAIRLAIIHRHDELALDAWLALVAGVGHNPDRIDIAEGWLTQAEAFVERVARLDQRQRLRLENGRGRVAFAASRYREAAEIFSRAIERGDADDPLTWDVQLSRAGAYLMLGEVDAARTDYEALLQRFSERWGTEHPKVGKTYLALGQLHVQHLGALDVGEQNVRRALAIFAAALGNASLEVASAHSMLSVIALYRGQYEPALLHAKRALKTEIARLGHHNPQTATTLMNVGTYNHLLGRYPAAVDAYQRALAALEASVGPDHEDVATAAGNLGESLLAMGKLHEAQPHFERSLRMLEARRGASHPYLAYPLKGLGLMHLALDQPRAAVGLLERALKLTPTDGTADLQEKAEISWGLAQALRKSGRTPRRARLLAQDALSAYRALGAWTARRAAIKKWLRR